MFGRDGLLWVTAELDRAVLAIDPDRKRVVASVPTGGAAHWLAVHPEGACLYLSNKGADRLGVLDLATRRISREITIPGGCEGLTVSADGRWLFVASN